ncbi:ubiquinol-cytochrome C chaperone-domain-containing protein [Spinellus fusiger]|nr:ubiquinol-cytochrome C chaperone-domain-containing protein [Spinellus fusiger]
MSPSAHKTILNLSRVRSALVPTVTKPSLAMSSCTRPLAIALYSTQSPQPPQLPQPTQPEKKHYSESTKSLVYGLARLMGYYSEGSTAIRSSHDLYQLCSKQLDLNKDFFIQTCHLPDNFQTWFSVTQLHVWMLMVRLRAEDNGKLYIQEIVNRFFDDTEDKIREYGISQQRVIKSYIKDLLAQFHGGVVAYDEGMCKEDPVLAAALWRNLFAPSANNAADLANMVHYIRRELKALESIDGEQLNAGKATFSRPSTYATHPL